MRIVLIIVIKLLIFIRRNVAILILIFTFFFSSTLLKAQFYFIAEVTDSVTGELIPGVAIVQSNTTNGASTDINGRVKISLSDSGFTRFKIDYLGYQTKLLTILIPQRQPVVHILLQASENNLEEVSITSDRTNSRLEDVPTRIEVIAQDDLTEENGIKPGNITSILGDVAGIQLQQVSVASGNIYARIEGLSGRYTQILRDGIPEFSGASGGFSLLQIPPLDLKQIEIIKGSASTLYGGDAIAGIINLIDKEPNFKRETSFTINQSTLNETNLNAFYSKTRKKIGISLFSEYTNQSEKDIDKDGFSDVSNIKSFVVHPKIIVSFNSFSKLTLNYTVTLDHRIGGDMNYFDQQNIDSFYHVNNRIFRQNFSIVWNYQLSDKKGFHVIISQNYFDEELNVKKYLFHSDQNITYSEFSYTLKTDRSDWVQGININNDKFINHFAISNFVPNYNSQTYGFFVQNTLRLTKDFIVESGFRLDYHSVFKSFSLPRLSLKYVISPTFTSRFTAGFGYKIPNILNNIDAENDLLRIQQLSRLIPELSKSFNADINFHKLFRNNLNLTVNQAFFLTIINHPIDVLNSTPDILNLSNASGSLRTRGIQTYMRLSYRREEIYLGYVFTDVEKLYDAAHPRPAITPRNNLSGTFFYTFSEKWRVGFESSFIAGQLDENYHKVPDYSLVASMVQFSSGEITIVLNAENLLDFRQNKNNSIYAGSKNDPDFQQLWAPIDGRNINLSIKLSI